MTALIFFMLATAMCAGSVLFRSMRTVLVCYWLTSLFFGAGVLTLGSELLAAAIWFVSTLLTAVFALHGLGFGELSVVKEPAGWRNSLQGTLPAVVGFAFSLFVIVGFRSQVDPTGLAPVSTVSLHQLSELFESRYLIATAVFPLAFLIAWIGAAYLSRADGGES